MLVLEYMPGIRIADKERLQAAGISTDLVAQRATEAYLQQILRHGFFHADPREEQGCVVVAERQGLLWRCSGWFRCCLCLLQSLLLWYC